MQLGQEVPVRAKSQGSQALLGLLCVDPPPPSWWHMGAFLSHCSG